MELANNDKPYRLFVAIELPQQVCDNLASICSDIAHKQLFAGRCTRSENIHLTLKFFGEVSESVVPEIDAALKKISFQSCAARLGPLGVFSTRKKIRILFIHILCPELAQLAQKIQDLLSDRFEPEDRLFKSHITLARVKLIDNKKEFLREVDEITVSPVQWSIDSFVLKRSVLTSEGPLYTTIARYPLF